MKKEVVNIALEDLQNSEKVGDLLDVPLKGSFFFLPIKHTIILLNHQELTKYTISEE